MNSIRRLPVICGYGGINSAGRSSSDLAYKRLVFDLLSEEMKNEVVEDLSNITNNETNKENFKNHTLVRKIDKEKYDSEGLMTETMNVNAAGQFLQALNQEAFINHDNIPLVWKQQYLVYLMP